MDYRQLVRSTAERHGIDPNLAEAVMAQESAGRPDAVSPAGARGLMQLMPGTAQELGVDPNDPAQNIDGGVRYLKQQIDRFGVSGGLAAYNAGPGRFQKTNGRFEALPAETRNYVPSVMNRAAEIAQRGGGAVNQVQAQAPAPAPAQAPTMDLPTLLGGFEKARAANDEEAVKEIGALLKGKFEGALASAQSAKDDTAVKEIQAAMGQYGFGSAPVAKPEAPKEAPQAAGPDPKKGFGSFLLEEAKGLGTKADNLVRGAADMLTFGFADEIAAKADSLVGGGQSGKASYDEALKAQRQRDTEGGAARIVGQVAGGLIPTGLAVSAPANASRALRALAGAATGGVQGSLYGAGSAEEGSRGQGALVGGAIGTAAGGALGAIMPSTARQEATKIINKAGGEKAAPVDAEIIRDLNRVAGGSNQRGNPVGANQLNSLENKYIGEVTTALKQVGRKPLEAAGLSQDAVSSALRDRRIIGADELAALRSTKAGTALADAIEKAQRARSLTAAVPSTGGVMPLVRELNRWILPDRVATPVNAVLGGRQTREAAASRLVSPKMANAAEDVLSRLGPSDATKSLSAVQQMATNAQTQAKARALAAAQAKAQEAATNQATRLSVLQETRRPLSGAFQELLPGGKANTNLQSKQAIDALRLLKKRGGVIGDAADEILKSRTVSNEDAFYGLQNAVRGLQERGVVPGAQGVTGAAGGAIRNPISYAEAVRTAGEAANLARQAAPNKALAQFATKIAGTKSPVEKATMLMERLAKTTDANELAYLKDFVEPLTKFGAK
jgi:hypothetical protein